MNNQKVEVAVLRELHKLLGESLAKIRSALISSKPILELELFDSEYDEKAALLKNMIGLIRRNNLKVDVYEIPSDQTFETSSVLKESLINLEILENILKSSDDEMDRQLDYS